MRVCINVTEGWLLFIKGLLCGSSWNRKLRARDKLRQGNSESRSGHRQTACLTSCVWVCVDECVNVSVCYREPPINLSNCLLLSITTNYSDLLTHVHRGVCTFNKRHTLIFQGWNINDCTCVREKELCRLRTTPLVNQVSCGKRVGQNVNAVVLFYSSTGTWWH